MHRHRPGRFLGYYRDLGNTWRQRFWCVVGHIQLYLRPVRGEKETDLIIYLRVHGHLLSPSANALGDGMRLTSEKEFIRYGDIITRTGSSRSRMLGAKPWSIGTIPTRNVRIRVYMDRGIWSPRRNAGNSPLSTGAITGSGSANGAPVVSDLVTDPVFALVRFETLRNAIGATILNHGFAFRSSETLFSLLFDTPASRRRTAVIQCG